MNYQLFIEEFALVFIVFNFSIKFQLFFHYLFMFLMSSHVIDVFITTMSE